MVTRDIINLFFGYVEFTAEKGFCERFINSCTADNIPLWDMHKKGSVLTAKTTPKGYRKIREPAKKSSMKVHITKKVGLPFFINRYSHRTGLIVGLLVAFVCLVYLSGHVWIIEVNGSERLSDSEVIEAFEDAGLKVGSRKSSLQLSQIESSAMLKLGGASWAAVNIRGCYAEINVRDLKEIPDIETHHGTSNIVARKDGQIAVLEAYRGSAVTGVGQSVLEGELIISGITENRLQENLFTDAHGYIVAKTTINVKTVTDNKITVCVPSERKIWSLYFLGAEIFPPKNDTEDYYENRRRLCINGKKLPFGINYRLYTSYNKQEATVSDDMAKLMAVTEYALESYYATQHTHIIEQNVTIEKSGDSFEVKGTYFCYENIGKSVSFDIEETDTPEQLSE